MPEQNRKPAIYELPEYAKDFNNLKVEEQEDYFAKFGLKNNVERKLFNFLCQIISDARRKTGNAVTSYKYYSDIILKWASNPNNLRAVKGFPRSEQMLKTNLDPLLKRLAEKGICKVMPSLDKPPDRIFITLEPESQFGAPAAKKELEDIRRMIEGEYDKVADDPKYPLPTRQQIETAFKHPLHQVINVASVPAASFNRSSIAKKNFQDVDLVEITISRGYGIIITKERLEKFPAIVARRMLQAIQDLPTLNTLETMIKEKFPAKSSLSMKGLLEKVEGQGMPNFAENSAVWTAIAHTMVQEIKRVVKDGEERHNKGLAVYLAMTWLTYERDQELESGKEKEIIKDLYKHIAEHPRYMTIHELRERPMAEAYRKKHGEDQFRELLPRFLKQYSLEDNPKSAVIHLKGQVIGDYYIHSKHILTIFNNVPSQEKEKIDLIMHRNFVVPISENLYKDRPRVDVQEWLDDDTKIEDKLREIITRDHPKMLDLHSFVDIHDFFAKNTRALSLLCSKHGVPEGKFLINSSGVQQYLRPMLVMLGVPGDELLRRAQKHAPLIRKYLYALRHFFSGKSAGRGRGKHETKDASSASRSGNRTGGAVRQGESGNAEGGRAAAAGGGDASSGAGPGKMKAPPKLPPGAKKVSSKAVYTAAAKDKSADFYLGIWNRVLGEAADQNLRICHAIIKKKTAAIERRLKAGQGFVNVPEQAGYIAYAPQLGHIKKKDELTRYVQIKLLEELEKIRKEKNLRFEYITTPR